MNIKLIFFILSTSIFILSIIAICCAPIINKINSDFGEWKSLNCGLYSDLESLDKIKIKDKENYKYFKNLCYRQKAMSNLEYTSLIITSTLSFICFYLSLLYRLDIGTNYKNFTGLFGFISGIICFILTFVYVCYNGYIFNNDIAFGKLVINNLVPPDSLIKLFPNGALYKWIDNKYISNYEDNSDKFPKYIKYKDLGDKQYNYDSELYKKYFLKEDSCFINDATKPSSRLDSCDYIFYGKYIKDNNSNKYLYDRWLVTLILSCFIFLLNICLSFFGFLIFKEEKDILETANVNYDTNSFKNIIQFNPKNNDEINANNNPN